jgi:tetratricopeptide (TPR) repeat protein
MKKVSIFLSIVAAIGAISLFINFFAPKPDIVKKIDDLRKETASGFDSFTKKLNAQNRFFDSIQYLISSGQVDAADNIIDQLLKKWPNTSEYYVLKGQAFDARKKYDSALYEYDFAIRLIPSPNALDRRARTFIKMKRYDEAIRDYRTAYEQNYDFSYKLAQTFEIAKQKDSALKYYKVHLEHYPDSILQKKITLLQQ